MPSKSAFLRFFRHPLALALLAVLVIAPGIWLPTGLTGKDEYFLGLRTPMEMMNGQHWLVPFLDGAPRIKKPPLLYWLGRASFESFGISLASARIVAVFFAALLVASTAGIARRLTREPQTGLIAGMVLLGCLGLHSEGRRFMLDVPVAALSAAAFWSLMIWFDQVRHRWLALTALLLAAGFLVKGPIVALIFGGGTIPLILANPESRRSLASHRAALTAAALLAASLALPWFIYVRMAYPEAAQLALADEMESRRFLDFSPGIVLGLLNIGLPWVFIFLAGAWAARREEGLSRQLLLWFLLTFAPFLFLKSFDRYLIGSLVPLAIFIAVTLPRLQQLWPWRLGLTLALLLGASLTVLGVLIGNAAWVEILAWLAAAAFLSRAWWRPSPEADEPTHLLLAPIVYGAVLLWLVFPSLGVNAVPKSVVELGSRREVAMFDGPQPALLPILSQRPHRHFSRLSPADIAQLSATNTLVFVEEGQVANLQNAVQAAGFRPQPSGEFMTLASHGSGLRFARVGASWADWQEALRTRNKAPLATRIYSFTLVPQ